MANLVTADGELLKEVGQVALRSPSGEFLEKQPIYVKVSKKDVNPKTQMLPREEKTLSEVAALFAEKFAQYVNGCKAQGIDIGI